MPTRTRFARLSTSVRSASDPYNPLMVNGTASSFPNGDPFPYTFNPKSPRFLLPASIESIGTNVQWPYIYQFNLAVQRQLPWQVALTAAYVGTISRDVPTMVDGNYAPYVPGIATRFRSNRGGRLRTRVVLTIRTQQALALWAQNIFLITNQTASYHSLQIAAGRPMSRNVMVNGFYVWSHAIQSSNESAIGQMTAQDFANLWEEKGPMDADRRNVATISGHVEHRLLSRPELLHEGSGERLDDLADLGDAERAADQHHHRFKQEPRQRQRQSAQPGCGHKRVP